MQNQKSNTKKTQISLIQYTHQFYTSRHN